MELGWFETGLDVADIERSLAFYRKLGFQLVDGGVDAGCVTLQNRDCRLSLFQGQLDPPQTQLMFWQGDVQAICAELMSKGFRFERGPTADDKGAGALLKDPDGHPLCFTHMPINFVDSPKYAHPVGAYQPGAAQYPPNQPGPDDLDLGWFEISLDVQNAARTADFYRTLGFQLIDDHDPRNVTLQSGDCRLSLYQGYLDPAQTQLIFWQGDVEAIVANLTAKGLRFERGILRDDKGIGAMLIDPDGHPIYFVNIRGVVRKEPA